MEERQVTVDGITHILPRPFLVLATQNPIEYEGTFPLPEAQVDRFLIRLRLGYPGSEDEIRILERQQYRHPIDDVQQVVSVDELMTAQAAVKDVFISQALKRYIIDLIQQTRQHVEVYLGASPRGSLALFRMAQAKAAISGRDYVLPDDIKALVVPTLAHRVILGPGARLRDLTTTQIVEEIVSGVAVPGGDPTGYSLRSGKTGERNSPEPAPRT
jgi:MoxR-like ATPase